MLQVWCVVEVIIVGVVQSFEHVACFVCWQVIGYYVFGVVKVIGDQWLVGVVFEEGDQYFHVDMWDGDGVVTIVGSVGVDVQLVVGFLVGLVFAILEELYFYLVVLVVVDFFVGGISDYGVLIIQNMRFWVGQGRFIWYVLGSCEEVVVVVLVEVIVCVGVCFVGDFTQQG